MRKQSIMAGITLLGILLFTCAATQAQSAADRERGTSAGEKAPAAEAKVLAPTPPAGQAVRYVIPYYTSQTLLAGARSTTLVDVYNQSAIACNVGVQFQFAFGTSNICSITLSIPPKQSRLFCSRPVNDPLYPCTVSCPGAGLTFNTGHAFVSSTLDPNLECERIAVHAQLAFTRDPADDQVEGTTQLTIVKINEGNKGD